MYLTEELLLPANHQLLLIIAWWECKKKQNKKTKLLSFSLAVLKWYIRL